MQGAGIRFQLRGAEGVSLEADAQLEVYTTRPDTVGGQPSSCLSDPAFFCCTAGDYRSACFRFERAACVLGQLACTDGRRERRSSLAPGTSLPAAQWLTTTGTEGHCTTVLTNGTCTSSTCSCQARGPWRQLLFAAPIASTGGTTRRLLGPVGNAGGSDPGGARAGLQVPCGGATQGRPGAAARIRVPVPSKPPGGCRYKAGGIAWHSKPRSSSRSALRRTTAWYL